MFRKIVPSWVRHLSRVVLTEDAVGRLDLAEVGAFKYRRQRTPHRHGRLFVGLTVLGVVLYCVALMEISYDPQTSAPLHCQGGPGFRILSEIVHGFSSKELPDCKVIRER